MGPGKSRSASADPPWQNGHQTEDSHTSAFIVSRWDTSGDSKKITLQKQEFSEAAWLEPEKRRRVSTDDPPSRLLSSLNPCAPGARADGHATLELSHQGGFSGTWLVDYLQRGFLGLCNHLVKISFNDRKHSNLWQWHSL